MQESKKNQLYWIGLGVLALVTQFFLFYIVYWYRQYLVPPGGDVAAHYRLIQDIFTNGLTNFGVYPRLFHLLVIAVAKISQKDIFYVLTTWTPILIFLPVFPMFFLLRQIFSLKITILSLIVMMLASTYTFYAFVDGSYPEMLAYGVFAVLLFGFILRYYRTGQRKNLLYAGLFLVLIGLTHHFTLFNVLAILGFFGLLQFYFFLARSNFKLFWKYLLGLGVPALVLVAGFTLVTTMYDGMVIPFVKSLLSEIFSLKNLFYWNEPLVFSEFPRVMGGLVWYLGTVGFFYVLISSFVLKEQVKAKQLVIIWFLYLFALSHFSSVGISGRFVREMVYPSLILGGFLLAFLLEQNQSLSQNRLTRIVAYGMLSLLIFTNSPIYSTGLDKIPDGLSGMIWYLPIDQEKVNYMEANLPSNATILYNHEANMFTPLKSPNKIVLLKLNSNQLDIVDQWMTQPEDKKSQAAYDQLILELKGQYKYINYILNDVRPPGEVAAATQHGKNSIYEEQKRVLASLATEGQPLKSFIDSATLYQMK